MKTIQLAATALFTSALGILAAEKAGTIPATPLRPRIVLTNAAAARPPITLKVGMAAPALQTAKFVQGEPVKEFAPGTAYIVEFWATWCGPCIVSIPHLNELHEKFKDKGLVVIGQDCWERDESKVDPFIQKMGAKMTYRVALDLKADEKDRGAMATTWMQAAGQNGIPSAFVVNKEGKIAWIGHPMQLKESLLEEVLAGTFDIAKAAAEQERQAAIEPAKRAASLKLSTALRAKKWDDAAAAFVELEKHLTTEESDRYAATRMQILLGQGQVNEAVRFARQASDAKRDDSTLQNALAWSLAIRDNPGKAELELAALLANRANDAAGGKNATILDTLARVKFLQGKKTEAVALQQKAIELSEGKLQERFKQVLASYQDGRLPAAQ